MLDKEVEAKLRSITLSQLRTESKPYILEIDSEATVYDALKILLEHGFCSAPVIKHGCTEAISCVDRYVGILAPHNILECFVKCYDDLLLSTVDEDVEEKSDKESKYVTEFDQMKNVQVKDIIGKCPFTYLKSSTCLYDCLQIMSQNSTYRICVVDENDPCKLVNFITKKMLEDLLLHKIMEHPHFGSITLKDLQLTTATPVVTINEHQRTIDAFKKLVTTGYSGLPVVNSIGSLIGKISVKDIYFMFTLPNLSSILRLPIKKYLEVADIDIGSKITTNPPIGHDTDTLAMVISLFFNDSWNRLFLVDKEQKPIRCITFFDLLRKCL
ncbi:hypothetical protein WA158_001024 [Blastocystis sp. Blastoise]